MIPSPAIQIALALDRAAERTMANKPTQIEKGYTVKDGKIVKAESHAKLPPHVRCARKNKRKWRAAK